MLNIFDFYDNPSELNNNELQSHMHLLESIVSVSKRPNAKEVLAPVLNIIKKSPEYAYLYIITVLKKRRWKEVEPVIMKDAYFAFNYALNVLGEQRWKEAEPVIMKDPHWAYRYAEAIIKGRWLEAEPYIIKDPEYAYQYAKNILKQRWSEAEEIIMGEKYWWNKYHDWFIANY